MLGRVLLLLLLGAPVPVWAHAILMESQPAAGSVVGPGAVRIVLRFNSKIDAGRSRVELRDADVRSGRAVQVLPVEAGPGADVLVAPVSLVAGAWVVRWQVLAVDGHITRGDVKLTVK